MGTTSTKKQDAVEVTIRRRSRDDAWMENAACKDDDPFIYDERFEDRPPVGVSCWFCPERITCLNYALRNRFDGVWGGTTERQRRAYARRQRRARCPDDTCRGREIKRGGRTDTCISCGLSWPAVATTD